MPVVHQGKRYRATIALGLLSLVSNATVADKVREVGFTAVEVSDSGRNRSGQGLWPTRTPRRKCPREITSVKEIEV